MSFYLIKKYSILKNIEKQINKYYNNKSNIIQNGNKNVFDIEKNMIIYQKTDNEYVNLYNLVHEISHFFQYHYNECKYEIPDNYKEMNKQQKKYLDFEFEANALFLRYLYFIEKKDAIEIQKMNRKNKIFACSYFRDLMSHMDCDIDIKGKMIIDIELDNCNIKEKNANLIIFKNNQYEDIAHISKRDDSVWFAFHNGNEWIDFIAHKALNKKFSIEISDTYDIIKSNGARWYSHYNKEEKKIFEKPLIKMTNYLKNISVEKKCI